MKKLLYLLLILPLLSISCSSDNDDDADIVGTWLYDSSVATEVITNNDSVTQIIKDHIATGKDADSYPITFTKDGKTTSTDGVETYYGTYTLSGNKLIMEFDEDEDEPLASEISISDNILSMNTDETEYYQKQLKYIYPRLNMTGVIISKVTKADNYKRQ